MTPGSRPPVSAVGVDTSAIEARLRAEIAEAIDIGREHERSGNRAEAEWWTLYVAALFGLVTDHWALMTIALEEMEHD